MLALMLALTPQAFAFVDHGTNNAGSQCFDESCHNVYSKDLSCSISNNDANNVQYNGSCKLFSARYSNVEAQRAERIARIKKILGIK